MYVNGGDSGSNELLLFVAEKSDMMMMKAKAGKRWMIDVGVGSGE